MLDKDSADAKGAPADANRIRDFQSILKQRRDIPAVVRELYGENLSVFTNYVTSVSKMAGLLSHREFINTVREAGLANGFMTDPAQGGQVPENYRRIDGTKNPQLRDLDGLFTTPETSKALEQLFTVDNAGSLYRAAARITGYSKASVTIYNLTTHFRNFASNAMFAASNGDLIGADWKKSFNTVIADLTTRGDKGTRDYIQRLAELRILDSNVDVGLIKAMAADLVEVDTKPLRDSVWSQFAGAAGDVSRSLSRAYNAGDAIWKLNAFQHKVGQYAEAFPEASQMELERLAAIDVLDHYPTYSKLPRAIRGISTFPMLGDFVSFPAEMIRVTKNQLRSIHIGMRSENPVIREMAAQRLVGTISSFAILDALSGISSALLNVSPEDEESLRRFQAPWSVNSKYLYLGKDGEGNYDLIDLSFMDARAVATKAVLGSLREGDVGERFERAITELAAPLNESMIFGKAMSWIRNKTPDGRKVYNEQASAADRAAQAAGFFGYELFAPGTLDAVNRIKKGMMGEVSRGGKIFDPFLEAVALFGLRVGSTDISQSFGFRNGDMNRAVTEAEQGIRQTLSSRGTVRPGKIAHDYRMFNESRRKLVSEWHDLAQAAIRLGVPEHEVNAAIIQSAGRPLARQVISGKYSPYMPSDDTLQTIATRPNGMERVVQLRRLYDELAEQAQGVAE